jgi:predicted N-acetyltransferase YhbS
MSKIVTIRRATPEDIAAISALHARVFGPGRFARSAYRVREGKGHLSRFCLVAEGPARLKASLRMTEITIGGVPGAALLGPIAVEPEHRGEGLGTRLVNEALAACRSAGARLVILVGDVPYYGRFGFKPVPAGQIAFPGPVNQTRILAVELEPGALESYRGMVAAASVGNAGRS